MRPGLDLSVLDALRGLAALYVVLHHARWLLWASQREYVSLGGQGVGLVVATLSSSLIFGHQAVMFFFLLSGFCIHYRQAKSLHAVRGTGFNVASFGLRRIRRLYPMLLVALALTAILDQIGMHINPQFYSGNASAPSVQAAMEIPSYSLHVMIGNLLMQGSLSVATFGTNVPLWSLAYEAWFYLLYPVLLMLTARARAGGMLLVILAISLIALLFPQFLPIPAWLAPVLSYWVVWAIGAVIAEAYVGRIKVPGLHLLGIAGAVLSAAMLAAVALDHATEESVQAGTELLVSVGLAGMLTYALLGLPAQLGQLIGKNARRLHLLGDISYSLYVVHYPWLVLVSALWLTYHARLPLGAELATAGVASALALGWCCWYLVERRFVSTSRPSASIWTFAQSTPEPPTSPGLTRFMGRLVKR